MNEDDRRAEIEELQKAIREAKWVAQWALTLANEAKDASRIPTTLWGRLRRLLKGT